MMTQELIQQMVGEESDEDEYFGFESLLLILIRLIRGFDSRGFISPKSASYTRVYTVNKFTSKK